MKLYCITYRDTPSSEQQTTTFRGHDAEHAENRFLDSLESEGGNEGVIVESVIPCVPIAKNIARFYSKK